LSTKKTSDSNNFWSFDNRRKMIFSTHEVKMQKGSVFMQRKCCEFSFVKRKVVNFFHWKCYGQIFPQANCENKAIRKKGLKKLKKKKLDSKIVEEKSESNFQQFWSRENANETVTCTFSFSVVNAFEISTLTKQKKDWLNCNKN
jgi:hypothetical protein